MESNVVHEELVLIKKENSDLKKKITEDAIITDQLKKEKMEQIFMLQTEITKLKQTLREELFLKSGKFSIQPSSSNLTSFKITHNSKSKKGQKSGVFSQ